MHFFVTWEQTRQLTSFETTSTVPTLLNRQGDFSDLRGTDGQPIPIYDPATGSTAETRQPFPNNRIPADRFSATAKQYIALARSVLVPNRGAVPGTFAYVNNNYVSEGRSTIVGLGGGVDYLCSARMGLLPEIVPCWSTRFAILPNLLFMVPLLLLGWRAFRSSRYRPGEDPGKRTNDERNDPEREPGAADGQPRDHPAQI